MRFPAYRFLLALGIVALGLTLHGCDDDDDPAGPGAGTALVRVAHLSSDAGAVDVRLERAGLEVFAADDVEFGTFTPYLELDARSGGAVYDVTVVTDGGIFERPITVTGGTVSTVAAVGRLQEVPTDGPYALEIRSYRDDLAVTDDDAALTFVHAAAGLGDVDVILRDGTDLFLDVSFGELGGTPAILPGGEYDLQFRQAETLVIPVAFDDLDLSDGTTYTVWAVELPIGGVSALVTVDAPDAATTEVRTLVPAPQTAQVRLAHLSPDAGTVSVLIDDAETLTDVEFGHFSNYIEFAATYTGIRYNIKVRNAVEGIALDVDQIFEYGEVITVAITGTAANLAATVIPGDATPGGDARIDFAHVSPDVGPVDVTLTDGTELFADVDFRESASDPVFVPGGDYDLQVRGAEAGPVLLSFEDVAVADATNYTLWAVSLPGGGVTGLLSIDDLQAAETTVVQLDPATVDVRFAHFSPDAPPVDVYLNTVLFVGLENLPFAAVSDFLTVSSATQTFAMYGTGADPSSSTPLVQTEFTLVPGVNYTFVALGLFGSLDAEIVTYDGETPPAGQAFVRFFHASPDAPLVDLVVTSTDPDFPLFEGTSFAGDVTQFVAVDAGTITLEARLPESGNVVAIGPLELTLQDGDVKTIYAVGLAEPDAENALQAVVVDETTSNGR